MTYRKWSTAQERAAAVAAYESSGKSAAAVAAELGVPAKTLESWVRSQRRAVIDPAGSMTAEQIDEIARLQRENRALRRDVDFLKKADAFFRELDRRERGSR